MKTIVTASILILFISACSSNNTAKVSNGNNLLGYNITFGQSGGFTGSNQGYYIDSTGTVKYFSGLIIKDENMIYKGRLSDDQIEKIKKGIPSVTQLNYKEKGNLTNYIVLKSSERELRFSWSGPEPIKEVPPSLVEFEKTLKEAINQLGNTK